MSRCFAFGRERIQGLCMTGRPQSQSAARTQNNIGRAVASTLVGRTQVHETLWAVQAPAYAITPRSTRTHSSSAVAPNWRKRLALKWRQSHTRTYPKSRYHKRKYSHLPAVLQNGKDCGTLALPWAGLWGLGRVSAPPRDTPVTRRGRATTPSSCHQSRNAASSPMHGGTSPRLRVQQSRAGIAAL